jgi:hypothetical protein
VAYDVGCSAVPSGTLSAENLTGTGPATGNGAGTGSGSGIGTGPANGPGGA